MLHTSCFLHARYAVENLCISFPSHVSSLANKTLNQTLCYVYEKCIRSRFRRIESFGEEDERRKGKRNAVNLVLRAKAVRTIEMKKDWISDT